MSQRRKILLCVLALLLIGGAIFWSRRPHDDTESIRIGILLPLTGQPSAAGRKIEQAYQYTADEINSAGGVRLGDRSLPIRLIVADSEAKPDVGVQQAERLIAQENVLAICGCYQSNVAIPTTALADRLNTLYIVDNPIADAITERGLRFVFRIAPRADVMAKAQVEFLKDTAKTDATPIRTAALLFENTEFGVSASANQRKALEAAGIKVIGELSYTASGTDYASTIATLKKLDPDIVLATSYTPDAIQLARTMRELDYIPRIAFMGSTAGHQDVDFISALKKTAENVLTYSYWNPDIRRPGATAFQDGFRRRFDLDPVPQCINARTALWVLKDAIERVGTLDKRRLRDQLAATNLAGDAPPLDATPAAELRFDDAGENAKAMGIVMQVQDGKFVTVWPKKLARGAVRWPKTKDKK